MEKGPIEILKTLYTSLPYEVVSDICHRMEDWLAMGGKDTDRYMCPHITMGGKDTDRYMWAQIDYANAIIKIRGRKNES